MAIQELILVRYGQYQDGHLTLEGKKTMREAAGRIESYLEKREAMIISAPTPRATESANIIAGKLRIAEAQGQSEIYAADEEGVLPDCAVATELILRLGERHLTIIAVASREYIETLPAYILENVFDMNMKKATLLERGEALVVDFIKKSVVFLK